MYVNFYVILIYGMHCLYSGPVVLSIYSPYNDFISVHFISFICFKRNIQATTITIIIEAVQIIKHCNITVANSTTLSICNITNLHN
jgi:hypothetical protein